MNYMTVKQASEKWGVSPRRVQTLCKQGKIPGAHLWERTWMLPQDSIYPGHIDYAHLPMPRKTPFLDMTDLYHTPGKALACAEALQGQPEAKALFEAEIAYSQGNIDAVYQQSQYFLEEHSGFYAVLAGGMLMGMCAMWKGDLNMWKKAKIHICEAPCRNDTDRSILDLALASLDLAVMDTRNFPEWFTRGDLSPLPLDSHPAARVYYVKYLMVFGQDIAMERRTQEGVYGLGLIKMLPYLIEPMISEAQAEKIPLAELYLRLMCAVVCQNGGNQQRAIFHVDKAISLALPDMLLGPLVEFRGLLGYLLDERLSLVDEALLKRTKELSKQFHEGWIVLHNYVLERHVSAALSVREREVARLAAFGCSDGEIADQLQLSKSTVKSLISMARNKTGAVKRSDLVMFI